MVIVGVTVHTDDFSQLKEGEQAYIHALQECGVTPVLLVHTSDFTELQEKLLHVDGVLITGGEDVHPCHYGRILEENIQYMDFNRDRDLCELQLARWCWQTDLPCLGICRGNQIMNVALGGTLISDLPTHHRSHTTTHFQEKPYDRVVQKVHVQPGTMLFQILFGDAPHVPDIDWVISTNSMHHQAIEHPAYGMYVNAIATDGVYEGMEDPTKAFYLGVQWHPEYLPTNWNIFRAFRDACAKRKAGAEAAGVSGALG